MEAKRRRCRVRGAAGGWLVLWKKCKGFLPRQPFFKDKLFGGKETKLSQMASKHQVRREVRCHDGDPPKKRCRPFKLGKSLTGNRPEFLPELEAPFEIGRCLLDFSLYATKDERSVFCCFIISCWGFLPFCPLKIHLFGG